MLCTPLGKLIVLIDQVPFKYQVHKAPLNRSCSALDGRWLITVPVLPDGKEHWISCTLQPNCTVHDYIETGNRLECKSFYSTRFKLSIGASCISECANARDFSIEYMPYGVQYHLLPSVQSQSCSFGIAWLEHCTSKNDIQTWAGADPAELLEEIVLCKKGTETVPPLSDLSFYDNWPQLNKPLFSSSSGPASVENQISFPLSIKEKSLRVFSLPDGISNPDILLHLTIDYHRTLIPTQDPDFCFPTARVEQIILDRTKQTLTYRFRTEKDEFSSTYRKPEWIEYIFSSLDCTNFPCAQATDPPDILSEQPFDPTFAIHAYYSNGKKHSLCGRLDHFGIPQDFALLSRRLRNCWDYLDKSELLNFEIYDAFPRRASDLMFCDLSFDKTGSRTYSYLCDIPGVSLHSWVLAPLGRNNTVSVGYVRRILYTQPDASPYPIEKTKRIWGLCSQQDLEQLEKENSRIYPYSHLSSCPLTVFSSHKCPLLGHQIYWGGQGGCCDVQNTLSGFPEFMDHFELPFDPETALDICGECGWSCAAVPIGF